MEREIELAIEVLRKGGIILYPTDTVWGYKRGGCGEGLRLEAQRGQEVDVGALSRCRYGGALCG